MLFLLFRYVYFYSKQNWWTISYFSEFCDNNNIDAQEKVIKRTCGKVIIAQKKFKEWPLTPDKVYKMSHY